MVERQRSNISCVRRSLEHTQYSGIQRTLGASPCRLGVRDAGHSGDVAGSAVTSTDARDGVWEGHCAARNGLMARWSSSCEISK
jgi:hypothetical protein